MDRPQRHESNLQTLPSYGNSPRTLVLSKNPVRLKRPFVRIDDAGHQKLEYSLPSSPPLSHPYRHARSEPILLPLMKTVVFIPIYILGQQLLQMTRVPDNHMVKKLFSLTSEESFDVWILPGRMERIGNILDQSLQEVWNFFAIDPVIISVKVSRKLSKWRGFSELLNDPRRIRIF